MSKNHRLERKMGRERLKKNKDANLVWGAQDAMYTV